MTVEERVEWCLDQKGGRPLFGDEAREIIRQALRDQIEDCAKVANKQKQEFDEGCWVGQCKDGWANQACLIIGHDIRALAGQTDQTEGKEGKR